LVDLFGLFRSVLGRGLRYWRKMMRVADGEDLLDVVLAVDELESAPLMDA
jgi:hypothetical protein